MVETFSPEKLEQKFKTPQEELAYLREQIVQKEKEILERNQTPMQEDVIRAQIEEHKERKPEKVLEKGYALHKKEVESIVLDLSPEEHDDKMAELINILQDKGVLNALVVVEKLKDAHVEDDFHRFLVQYIKAGFTVADPKEKNPLFKALKMTLFEVSLPGAKKEEEKGKQLKEIVSKMEQFYAGMLSVGSDAEGIGYFTLELANPIFSNEIIFYISVPDSKRSLFERQAQSMFPDIKIVEKKDDYNIFNEYGEYAASYAEFASHGIFPIKTYEGFDHDPLNVLLNSFSKIDKDGEGAAIQIIVKPAEPDMTSYYKRVLKELEKGTKFREALEKADTSFLGMFKQAGKQLISSSKKPDDKKLAENTALNKTAIENIQAKLGSPLSNINIRIIASSATKEEANAILSDIESSFNQFQNTNGNSFRFDHMQGKDLLNASRSFSFRVWSDDYALPMSLKELTTVMHLPEGNIAAPSELKQSKANTAPAPLDLQKLGILLGTNTYRNIETPIHISAEDRLRHFYIIGQTGTGKTTLLKTMIRQDILNGEGVCMIDPHGSDIQEVLSYVPPERYDDLIYFDPSYTDRPMGLNMLEYDPKYPEQKTFVVNELLSIFKKLYGATPESMGPAFEQYFRNSALLVMDDPESGNTLVDISRVLSDRSYRKYKLSKCKNPLVVQFWENAERTTGDQGLANYVQYITNKFDVFLSNEIMRPIVSQEKSAFNFRDIMDGKKILLVNLAKGRLGDINSNLIGLIIVGKILMASLSRVDSFDKDLPPFYLYVDEFQNVTTDSISTILSEARKYKLSLTIAHQFIAQLEEKIKNSVFGNVGSMAMFRVSSEDAEYLEKQLTPVFSRTDLINLDNHNSYVKMLSGGRPVKPFSMETNYPPRGSHVLLDKIKLLSYLKYGRDRKDVEAEILEKYKKAEVKP
jgi:hypothetical protein